MRKNVKIACCDSSVMGLQINEVREREAREAVFSSRSVEMMW